MYATCIGEDIRGMSVGRDSVLHATIITSKENATYSHTKLGHANRIASYPMISNHNRLDNKKITKRNMSSISFALKLYARNALRMETGIVLSSNHVIFVVTIEQELGLRSIFLKLKQTVI